MKKLSFTLLASFVLMMLFIIISGGRGYTKDNFNVKTQTMIQKEEYYYANLSDSVVQIFANRENANSFGSGFFINNDKYVVTNFHVVKDAKKMYVMLKEGQYAYEAKLFAFDSQNDIAILKMNSEIKHNYLPLTTDSKKNDNVYTCGFATNYTVSSGKVMDTNAPYKDNYYIDISNIVYCGNSGGPALNEKGEVIGIVTLGNSVSTSLGPTYKLCNLVNNSKISI